MNAWAFLLFCTIGIAISAGFVWQIHQLDAKENHGHRGEATGSSDRASEHAGYFSVPTTIAFGTDPSAITSVLAQARASGGIVTPPQISFGGGMVPPTKWYPDITADDQVAEVEPELIPTTVYAYKGLQFKYPFLHSSSRGEALWRPGKPFVAACTRSGGMYADGDSCPDAPQLKCNCGIHGTFDPYEVLKYSAPPNVLISFAATGRCIIGSNGITPRDKGIRAQYAELKAICTMLIPPTETDLLAQIDEAAEVYDVPVYRRIDDMVAYVEGIRELELSTEV